MTKAKKPTQTFQPTPVRSAIRSILFIVPRSRLRVPSNWSFIFSAKAVESLISPPMAFVNCKGMHVSLLPYTPQPQTPLSII